MISTPDRERAVRLIKETTAAGARTFKVCDEIVKLHPKLTHLPPIFASNIDPRNHPTLADDLPEGCGQCGDFASH